VKLLHGAGCQEVVSVGRHVRHGTQATVLWDIGSERPPKQLCRSWDVVVNTAANTRWTMSPTEAYRANVATVEALRAVVGSETHLVHISTAYADGLQSSSSSADVEDYRNTYEWSKAYAERSVRETFPNAAIVRPTLVVGRRTDGRVSRFAGIYTLLRGIASSTIPAVISTPLSYLDVVPVDDLAKVIVGVVCEGNHKSGRVLTVASGHAALRVEEAVATMVTALNSWRSERGCSPHDLPTIISPDSWARFFLPFLDQHLSPRQHQVIGLLRNYEPYLQIEKPIEPTHEIRNVAPCLVNSVRYWADVNERLARLPARQWKMDTRRPARGAPDEH
jgi:dTDP-4-dehydrorhamnose reductase